MIIFYLYYFVLDLKSLIYMLLLCHLISTFLKNRFFFLSSFLENEKEKDHSNIF